MAEKWISHHTRILKGLVRATYLLLYSTQQYRYNSKDQKGCGQRKLRGEKKNGTVMGHRFQWNPANFHTDLAGSMMLATDELQYVVCAFVYVTCVGVSIIMSLSLDQVQVNDWYQDKVTCQQFIWMHKSTMYKDLTKQGWRVFLVFRTLKALTAQCVYHIGVKKSDIMC